MPDGKVTEYRVARSLTKVFVESGANFALEGAVVFADVAAGAVTSSRLVVSLSDDGDTKAGFSLLLRSPI